MSSEHMVGPHWQYLFADHARDRRGLVAVMEVPGRFIAIEKRKPRAISKTVGNLYGLASDGAKGWLGTDFATGRVLHVTETMEPRELLRLSKRIGGIEFVASRQLLIVAGVTENRISAYDLAPILKSRSR